jgi:pyridoxamine 5'-phosphate oxidase
MVLLKDFDQRGFVFYTNFNSRKGRDLQHNRACSLLFYWKELERQVRVEGVVEKIGDTEADAYFAARPFESRLGAYISPQSEIIPGREYLEQSMERIRSSIDTGLLSRPEYWGGYRVVPDSIEFWQGRENRLHDRFRYLDINGDWAIHRLAP